MNLIKLIRFNPLGDQRGELFSIGANKEVPFDIKRVYYMHGMDSNIPRGFHAHKELQQVAICLKGSCRFVMDDGCEKQETVLDSSATGILIDKLIWHEMHDFSNDCILVVLASDHFNENDYIRDYEQFTKKVNK